MSFPSHGARPSDPWKLARLEPAEQHPLIGAKMAGPLPDDSNLLGRWSLRFDQRKYEACTAHAMPAALAIALGSALAFIPSPRGLYVASGRVEHPIGPILDNGRQPADVVTAMRLTGLTTVEWVSPDEGTDITDTNLVDLDGLQLGEARAHRFDYGMHLIDPGALDAEDQIVATLDGDYAAPVCLAANVGSAFQALRPGDVAQPDLLHGAADGGHELALVGHRTRADASREYLLLNSWGPGWCDGGTCWASAAFVRACWELRPMTATPLGFLATLAAKLGLA